MDTHLYKLDLFFKRYRVMVKCSYEHVILWLY